MKMYLGDNDKNKLLKRYRIMQITSIILALCLCVTLYLNYDYMIFKLLISENYIYTEALDEIYASNLKDENGKGYLGNFDRIVMSIVTEHIREISGDKFTYLYTPQAYKNSKESEKTDAAKAKLEELTSEVIYISIPNFSKGTRQFMSNNKETLKNYKSIVIDLRDNYGGFLGDYYEMSRLFLDKGMILGTEKARLPIFSKTVKATKNPYFNFEKIYILQNKNTASSSEGFIMSLKENLNNVTLIGSHSYGKGIGQVTLPLTGGYAIRATVLKLYTPYGSTIQGIGIEPDISCEDEYAIEQALENWEER